MPTTNPPPSGRISKKFRRGGGQGAPRITTAPTSSADEQRAKAIQETQDRYGPAIAQALQTAHEALQTASGHEEDMMVDLMQKGVNQQAPESKFHPMVSQLSDMLRKTRQMAKAMADGQY